MVAQESVRQILVFADQTEQQMLGFNSRTAELTGFVASEEDHPPCSFSVSFEHNLCSQMPCVRANPYLGTAIPQSKPATVSTQLLRLFLILNEARDSNNNFIRNSPNQEGKLR